MRVVFLGSKRVGLRCLEAMLDCSRAAVVSALTLDDLNDVRTVHGSFLELTQRYDLPLHTLTRRSEVRPLLEQYCPDLCIVVGWYWMIPEDLIASVPLGFVGIHFSLLPLYRGSSPLVWAMINGERETGVSMFSLVKDVDAGGIWAQRRVEIAPDEYVGTVLARLEDQAVELIKDVFPRMLTGEARSIPQDHTRATFCTPRTPADGLIDWTWPARRVLSFVRGQSRPYPGAFTYADAQRITVSRASVGHPHEGDPGTVIRSPVDVYVVCGDKKTIRIDEAESKGRVAPLYDLLHLPTQRVGGTGEAE